MSTGAYEQGVSHALAAFGIRTAALQPHNRMPFGDMNLGAERFTKELENFSAQDHYPSGDRPARKNNVLDMGKATPAWGNPAPIESGSYMSGYTSGITPVGGV